MTFLKRYKKAIGGFVAGVAVALSLLPTDADPRLLALIPLVNALVVALSPANAPPPTGIITSRPTMYQRPGEQPKPPPKPRPRGPYDHDPLE